MAIDQNEMERRKKIDRQTRQAQIFTMKGEYTKAVDELIRILPPSGDLASDDACYVWAHACHGDTLFQLALSMENYSKSQRDHLERALKCFNKALGLKDNEDIKVMSEEHPRLIPWILAHRGEVLRTLANKIIDQDSTAKADRAKYYKEAIDCFRIATQLDEDYAWAYAHWGAALSNQRGDNKVYLEALGYLEKAIHLSRYNYPWAQAYKTVPLMQMVLPEMAYYDLLIAVRQDNTVLNKGIHPPAEFDETLPRGRRYAEAVWQYQVALDEQQSTNTQLVYLRYYDVVVDKNVPLEMADYKKLSENLDIKSSNDISDDVANQFFHKSTELWKQIQAEIDVDGFPAVDRYYISGGLHALCISEIIDEHEHKHYVETLLKELKQAAREAGGSDLDMTTAPIIVTEQEIKDAIGEKLCDTLCDDTIKNLIDYASDALTCLQSCLNEAADTDEKNSDSENRVKSMYQAKARIDVSWYYLRKLEVFKKMIGVSTS